MGESGGPQLFANNARHNSGELSFLPHSSSSLYFLERQDPFGFSPGTSPAPNVTKTDRTESFFSSQSHTLPSLGEPSFLPSNDFRYNPSFKNALYQPSSSQSVHQPIRLHIPSTTTQQKHGQLTPPSETTPTKESPPVDYPNDPPRSPAEASNGPATRKRRGTQQTRDNDALPQPTTTPRRRKKSARKQSSAGSNGEGGDKRNQFLERNRVAASKCRQKKKEWTSNLEQRARNLQASKTSLAVLVSSLREELLYLKGEALKHATCDCNSVREYLGRHAEASLPQSHLDHAHSPHSGSNFSFEVMGLDASIMQDSPNSSTMADNQDLPELSVLGQIPD
jgi:bZIP transcription factor